MSAIVVNWNYADNWFRRPSINWNCASTSFRVLNSCDLIGVIESIYFRDCQLLGNIQPTDFGCWSINRNHSHNWFQVPSTLIIEIVQTVDFGSCRLIRFVTTTDFLCCLLNGLAKGCCQLNAICPNGLRWWESSWRYVSVQFNSDKTQEPIVQDVSWHFTYYFIMIDTLHWNNPTRYIGQ